MYNIKWNAYCFGILLIVFGLTAFTGCSQSPEPPEGFVLVKSGTFQMGSEDGDDDEKPVHEVTITEDFFISKYEVTQREYERVMGENPSVLDGEDRPVEDLSWYDMVEYCNERSRMEGLEPAYDIDAEDTECDFTASGYRLPTEAEWEYAARGGHKARDTKYAGSDEVDEVAWYWKNSGDEVLDGQWDRDKIINNNCRTHPVGEKEANELGLYDMSGNVDEWCWDWYGEDYYEDSRRDDPRGPSSGENRVLRGGGWDYYASYTRVATRCFYFPTSSIFNLGFRLVRPAVR